MASTAGQVDWTEYLTALRLSDDVRVALQNYGQTLSEGGYPVIFDFHHLNSYVDVAPNIFRQMVNAPSNYYRKFTIPKRSGGERSISAPYPVLLETQRWINGAILSRLEVHSAAHAFVKEKSIVDNARQHLNRRALLRVDLKDFFPSISIQRILAIFRSIGYTPSVSYYLAALCTQGGSLPQGAATSPALSNTVVRRLDQRLSGLASYSKLNYSRYADDLIFSGDNIALSTVDFVRTIVKEEGFDVNERKTFLAIGDKKKIVTGISVAGEEMKLPKNARRSLRQELYYVKRKGFQSHMERTGQRHPLYIESLLGKFGFWKQIEPGNPYVIGAIEYLRQVQAAIDQGNF